MKILSLLETKVNGVGVVSFHVLGDLQNHNCIIGWDVLQGYGFDLNANQFKRGGKCFVLESQDSKGVCTVDQPSNHIRTVINKHKLFLAKATNY